MVKHLGGKGSIINLLMENGLTIKEVYLEQALDELEVLRKENEVLKRKLSKAFLILKKIKRLLMEKRNEKK